MSMSWIFIASVSYFFTAIANILDKLLLNKFLKAASIYAFYVGVLGVLAVVLIPFGVQIPQTEQLIAALAIGGLFVGALYMMYTGFLHGETTRVATLVGGSVPLYTFVISALFLGERLSMSEGFAFLFLIIGLGAISFDALVASFKGRSRDSYIRVSLISGLLFSLTFVGSSIVYEQQGFISGFFWMRMGAVLGALALLMVPLWRTQILEDFKSPKEQQAKSKSLLLGNQIIGALGFVLLNIAIDISPSVTLVNAMQGLQYVFIFILAVIMGVWIREVREAYTPRILFQKIIAMIAIATGLVFLVV